MRLKRNLKALSTLIWIILILCSIIFGALLSYIWVLGNYYAEPQNTINLVITNAVFPKEHGDTFNFTVLNTSNSVGAANITQIYVTAQGEPTILNVTETSPEQLPIIVERGTSKTVTCQASWGQFSGLPILVNLVTQNATVASAPIKTLLVDLKALPFFNPAISVDYFNLSITNSAVSPINLTLSDIFLNNEVVNNTSVTLPKKLSPAENTLIQCFTNWAGLEQPKVRVDTSEGYFAEVTANVSGSVGLAISDVKFNLHNPSANDLNITLSNSADSVTKVNVTKLILTTANGTEYPRSVNLTLPTNRTQSVKIEWPWKNYRNQNVNITALTKEGYSSTSKTVTTPAKFVFNFTATSDLTDTGHFLVNVTNEPCSLQEINVTTIRFNQNITTTSPTYEVLANGTTRSFNATFDWNPFRGQAVSISVTASQTQISKTITLPTVDLKITGVNFSPSSGIPYVNVTVENTQYSNRSITISQITFTINATAYSIDGTLTDPALLPNGYPLTRNTQKVIVCPWNWKQFHGSLVVNLQTKEGFTATGTFLIP
jgi:hypothetical protein